MTHYKHQILACDFFTVETLFLQTIYVLFFIELSAPVMSTSRVQLLNQTPSWLFNKHDNFAGIYTRGTPFPIFNS